MRRTNRRARLVVLGVATAVALVGCTSGGGKDRATESPTVLSLAEAQDVVVTRHYLDATVQITVHPIQVKDEVAALSVDYELVEPGTVADHVTLYVRQSGYVMDPGPYSMRLLDLEGQRVYQVLPSQEGKGPLGRKIASTYTKQGDDVFENNTLSADRKTASTVSLFVAPQATTVDVLVEPFGLVSGVAVVASGKDFDDLSALAGPPVLTGADAFVQPVRQFDVAYDSATTTEEIDHTVTIAVASDVLFASDDATLSDQATATLDQAVAEIEAATPDGTVKVIGHTDDVDTDAYNQTLSEQRAQTVKAYLDQRLGHDYQITAEGRGKREPVAQGTSAEARAANRRVEIVVQRTQATTQTTTDPAALPEAPLAVGHARDWVEYSKGDTTYRVRADQVVRTGGALVGYLEVGTVATIGTINPPLNLALFPVVNPNKTDTAARGYSLLDDYMGVQQVSLLTADARRYPYDYLEQPYDNAGNREARPGVVGSVLIGSDFMPAPSPTLLVAVVWPDTGTDTVTMEVSTLFRITDVPVTTKDPTAVLNATYPPGN